VDEHEGDDEEAAVSYPLVRHLDHLPIIGHALERLRVCQIVDDLVPRDPRSHVSTGECVVALVATILMGSHTLYLVDERLHSYDLEVALGFARHIAPDHFSDDRLAKAIDKLWEAGLTRVESAFVAHALREYELDVALLHLDTSSISVHGQYRGSQLPEDPERDDAVPHVTYGHSKDRRPDLKQVMYSLVATGDGMVPLLGRVASGNRADARELRFTIRQLVDVLPAPAESILVADCKAFCAGTLALFERHRLQYLTLMPRGLKVWDEAYAAGAALAAQGPLPLLKRKELDGRDVHWRGRSFMLTYEQEVDEAEATEAEPSDEGEKSQKRPGGAPGSGKRAFTVRALVVRSEALSLQKLPMLERRRQAEAQRLRKLQEKLRKRPYSCKDDADKEVERILKQEATFHRVAVDAVRKQRPKKRAKAGRPPKGEDVAMETYWEVELGLAEDPEAFARVLDQEGTFVLASNVPSQGEGAKDDAALLDVYDDQFKIEGAFHWAKTPLVVAPVFLKTPRRIAALGVVYVVALMAYALIQRQIRARLAEEGTYMSGNIGTTTTPTTEVLYRLFRGISTVRTTDDPLAATTIVNLNVEQLRLLDVLQCDILKRPGVVIAPPRTPRRGERAHRAYVRRKRELADEQAADGAELGRNDPAPE